MDLRCITHKYGGESYANHTRANIPAPGHSRDDRSVSIFLQRDGQVRVHCFTDNSAWPTVLRRLRDDNLISRDNILTGYSADTASAVPAVSDRSRTEKAHYLWGLGRSLQNSLSETYLRRFRKIGRRLATPSLRHAADLPIKIYDQGRGNGMPGLLASVTDQDGVIQAIELTYLDSDGARSRKLKLPRKTIGNTKPYQGIAVRIDPAYSDMVIGEGVPTVLSASDYFQLPCWALLSVDNFPKFIPPPGLKRLIIAGERDRTAIKRGRELLERLAALGVKATIEYPPESETTKADWNEFMGGKAN